MLEDPANPEREETPEAGFDPPEDVALHGDGEQAPPPSEGDIATIRSLLLGDEWDRLVEARHRRADPAQHAQDISRVLPNAIAIRTQQDDALGAALAPTLEESLKTSVKKNPQAIVDAIFPVMGPAIRRAVADTFLRAIQGLNEAIESSFSVQGIQWRIESWRTGKPYAEVVLLHKLVYRVEQVFLIHRETGLLLQHVQAETVMSQDADMVSGMLTAIQDFVKDSFKAERGDALNSMRVGAMTVWIEHSPHAILAAVIRGTPNQDLRPRMQQALERVSETMGESLADFQGDASVFVVCRPDLEPLLEEARRGAAPKRKNSTWLAWLVIGLLLGLLAIWGYRVWDINRRWSNYVHKIENEPGIMVTRTTKEDGVFSIWGFRDPFSQDVGLWLADFDLPADRVKFHWEQQESAAFVVPRAKYILNPPPGVTLDFDGGKLIAKGEALHRWVASARNRAALVKGVSFYDDSKLVDISVIELNKIKTRIEARKPKFIVNTTDLAPGQDQMFKELVRDIQAFVQLADSEDVPVRIELIGHTDSTGAESKNMRLSKQRSDQVAAVLVSAGVSSDRLTPLGVGATDPMIDEKTEEDRTTNRRVVIRVIVDARR